MTGNIAGRSEEEVKQFVLERLSQWIKTSVEDVDVTDDMEFTILSQIYDNIVCDKMLSKPQAKYLESKLEDDLQEHIDVLATGCRGSIIIEIDALSIYPDAWAMYCRPGAYACTRS